MQTMSSFYWNSRGDAPEQYNFHLDSHFEDCSSSVSVKNMNSFLEQEYLVNKTSQALKYVTRAFDSNLF